MVVSTFYKMVRHIPYDGQHLPHVTTFRNVVSTFCIVVSSFHMMVSTLCTSPLSTWLSALSAEWSALSTWSDNQRTESQNNSKVISVKVRGESELENHKNSGSKKSEVRSPTYNIIIINCLGYCINWHRRPSRKITALNKWTNYIYT